MTLIVPSTKFSSSTLYNKENEGIAINNNTTQGIIVQTVSNIVLCVVLFGKKKLLNDVFLAITQLIDLKLNNK